MQIVEKILKKFNNESKTNTSGTITDGAEHEIIDVSLFGNTYQQTYSGANLYDITDIASYPSGVTVDSDGWITVVANNTNGSSTMYKNISVRKSNIINTDTNYLIVCEVEYFNVTGTVDNQSYICPVNNANYTQFPTSWSFNSSSYQNKMVQTRKTRASFNNSSNILGSFVAARTGAKVEAKFRISVIADTTVTADTFVYQPFVGGIPSPNPTYPQTIQNVSGTVNVKVANGTDSSATGYEEQTVELTLPTGFELCKIGTYQDEILKQDGKWYKKKVIGKIVLDGTIGSYNTENNWYYMGLTTLGISIGDNSLLSDYFSYVNYHTFSTNNNVNGICFNNNNYSSATHLIIRNTAFSSKADYTEWFSSHNTTVYYVLNTPVLEEITDSVLKGQLDNLSKLKTYDGTTYITVSSSSQIPELTVSYYSRFIKRYIRNCWYYKYLQDIYK